jgi:preprotein translocase subunit YajC
MAGSRESDYKYTRNNSATPHFRSFAVTLLNSYVPRFNEVLGKYLNSCTFTLENKFTKIIILFIGGTTMTGVAYAAGNGAATGGAGGIASFIPLILIFAVFYFMLIRPQQKQAKLQQKFLEEMKNGNKVVTKGGIHGTITGLTDSVVTLEIADNVRIKVSRSSIGGPITKEGAPVPVKKGGG